MMTTTEPVYVPRSLDDAPQVNAALRALGLGDLRLSTLAGRVGRNDNWTGTTTCGQPVFVKQLRGLPQDVESRFRRLVRFEQFVAGRPLPPLRTPRCLGWQEDTGVLVYEQLPDAVTGAQLMVDQTFQPSLSAQIGRALAALHNSTLPPDACLDTTDTLLPSVRLLDGIPLELFQQSSSAQLQAWALLQQDQPLVQAVRDLTEQQQAAPVPAHCDLRVDQLLVSGEEVYLCDWEEFRVADAARDVGSYIGEWLYRAMLDIPTQRGKTSIIPVHLDASTVLIRGVTRLDQLRPVITAFWQAYLAGAVRHDDTLPVRSTAYAGWHLLDRLLAGAMTAARLQPIQRAAAGVGRRALLEPARFRTALGLTDPAQVAA